MPAKQNSGRLSSSANHTTSFFFVSGFGSGAYSAKLFAGTRQRFSGFSQPRQCGEDVLRMLVTGGAPLRGGGGRPPLLRASSSGAAGRPGPGGRQAGHTRGFRGSLAR